MPGPESSQSIPDSLLNLLKEHWGFDGLRPFQIGPIQDLHEGKHVLALLPTGGGKSLCFQLPALARGGVCLVISPLVSLMEDQCSALRRLGIKAEAWIGKNGDRVLDNVRFGGTQFLYLSPERLSSPLFLARHGYWNVQTIVIDEAHCISQWGHDFRPSFRKIDQLTAMFPYALWAGFTATATPRVLADIAEQMPRNLHVHRAAMRRPNLSFHVSTWGTEKPRCCKTFSVKQIKDWSMFDLDMKLNSGQRD